MSKFDELLKELQAISKVQNCIDWIESIPNDIYVKNFKDVDYLELDDGLHIDTHRWYELSTSVIEIHGRILGIHHVSNIFSESMMCSDCEHDIAFFEMEEMKTISYTSI